MRSEKGGVSLGFLIFLFLLAVGIYLGFKLIPPHWEYYSLKEAARQGLVSSAAPPYRDADVKEAILQKARNLGVPLSEADLALFRDRQAVTIEFSWEREVALPGWVKHYSFTIRDSEPIH